VSSGTSVFPMPDYGSAVRRSRLTAFAQRSRCGLILAAAPSGYGKSILAAQLAGDARFSAPAWIACSGWADGDATVISLLTEWLDATNRDGGYLLGVSSASMSESPRAEPKCVVLDDVGWVLGQPAVRLLESIRADNPRSLVVVTSRREQPLFASVSGCVVFGSGQLAFGADEVEALLDAYGVSDAGCPSELTSVCGGHPAVSAVLAQHLAASPAFGSGRHPDWIAASPSGLGQSITTCLSQLESDDRELAWVAAQMGEGPVDVLREVCGPASSALHRVADALPLVRLAGRPPHSRFFAHELLLGQLGAFGIPRDKTAQLRARCLDVLAAKGDWVRAARVLLEPDADSALVKWLPRLGEELQIRGEMHLLDLVLQRFGPGDYVHDPALLLLRAQALWAKGDTEPALATATVAAELARVGEDNQLRTQAALLVSRIHLGAGSYSLARSSLDSIVSAPPSRSALGETPSARAQLLVACCLLADRDMLTEQEEAASRLAGTLPQGSEARARILSALGLVSYFSHGNLTRAARLLQLVAESRDACAGTRLDGRANGAVALVGLGRIDQARAAARVAGERAEKLGFSSLSRTCRLILAGAKWSEDGDYSAWKLDVFSADGCPAQDSDRLSAGLDALYHGEIARAAGEFDDALAIVESGLRAASEIDAPLLRWSLQLESAAALAAHGDVGSALTTATEIGARVRSANVWPQRLKAALVEGECLRRMGEPESAAAALAEVAPYVCSGSGNWKSALYLRAYPALLGPLAAAVGVERLPAHLRRLIPEQTALEALSLASSTLRPDELESLSRRMLGSKAPTRQTRSAAPDPDPAVCTVRLFGAFEVRTRSGPVPDRAWGKRKARLLFAMMASRSGKDVPRDQLVEYLWPGMTEQRALNNFYVVWSAMKRALAPEGGRNEPCPYVEHVRGVCRVVPGRLQTDLDEFERLLVVARKARAADDQDIEMTVLAEIADLYRGELLPGDAYDDWFGPLRERCRHDFEDAMLRLAIILETRDDPQGGLAHLRKAMLFDPWREDLYQAALRLQITAGQRSAAIETYLACRARLVEDLGIDPSAETRRLYEHVLGMEA
jgi:DNA-binding SARP family transcriptional activator